ncbi:hypothetical protein [Deinococcus sp.]|uniref:hypothetical protein n=1 Tax=Deinococcus sp. TaxID=47478 RepID=UPI003CC68623
MSKTPGELPQLPPDDSRALSMLTTEHFALQGLRSSTISDSSGRASLFLASLSGTLVALSLLGNASQMGRPFVIAALILAPTLIFIGVATFARVLQSGLEDAFYAIGINRIRHLYLEMVPQYRPYFVQSDRDDVLGMIADMGSASGGSWQMMLSTAGTIGVTNSVLIGAFSSGLAMALLRVSLETGLLGGLLIFLASAALHFVVLRRAWYAFSARHPALFPSDSGRQPTSPT